MGYTIKSNQSTVTDFALVNSEKYLVDIDIESQSLGAPVAFENCSEVYFEIED
jgi:hypothetical protein